MLQKSILPFSKKPLSLVWEGDTLLDWVSGGNRYYLARNFTPLICPPEVKFLPQALFANQSV